MTLEDQIVAHLREMYQPVAIILHGSRARGSARENSDWDLYVFAQEKGVVGKTKKFMDHYLDVAVFSLPFEQYDLLKTFRTTLRYTKILFDKQNIAQDFIQKAQEIYALGNILSDQEITNRQQRFARVLSRLEGTIDDPLLFFYHAGLFFEAVIRYWFEVQKEWSEPPYIALPLIEQRDPAYYQLLKTIATDQNPKQRLDAYREISKKLFDK